MIGYLDYTIEVRPRADCVVVYVCWQNYENGPYLPNPAYGQWEKELRDGRISRWLFGSMDDRIAKAIQHLDIKAAAQKAKSLHYQYIASGGR